MLYKMNKDKNFGTGYSEKLLLKISKHYDKHYDKFLHISKNKLSNHSNQSVFDNSDNSDQSDNSDNSDNSDQSDNSDNSDESDSIVLIKTKKQKIKNK
jgi:hypothetical protein